MSKQKDRKEKRINIKEFRSSFRSKKGFEDSIEHVNMNKSVKIRRNVPFYSLVLGILLIGSLGINIGAWNVRYSEGETEGYSLGQAEGYSEGYDEGKERIYPIAHSAGFNEGIEEGKEIGLDAGFQLGRVEGIDLGFVEGNSSGFCEGYVRGEEAGLTEGYSAGYGVGYEECYGVSYEEGYIQGLQDGVGHGYNIRDPSKTEMLNFIASDQTDKREHNDDFVCLDFAATVKNSAFNSGFRCYVVLVSYESSNVGHAVVAFDTTDNGRIFIEPQNDKIMNVEIGKTYWDKIIEDLLFLP